MLIMLMVHFFFLTLQFFVYKESCSCLIPADAGCVSAAPSQ